VGVAGDRRKKKRTRRRARSFVAVSLAFSG
jgi:hypothetical protein